MNYKLPILFILGTILALLILFFARIQTVIAYYFSHQSPIAIEELTGDYNFSDEIGEFNGTQIRSNYKKTSGKFADNMTDTRVLGDSDAEKRIEVDLTNQRVYAYEGDEKVYDFVVSTGKWGRTPTGEFTIWTKIRYQKMSGGNQALGTYYYLPNVPYIMFFSNAEVPASRGFSLHGTYWHNNFGEPMSHGCINMRNEDAEKLYYWANPDLGDKESIRSTKDNPGTKVIIYGKWEGKQN